MKKEPQNIEEGSRALQLAGDTANSVNTYKLRAMGPKPPNRPFDSALSQFVKRAVTLATRQRRPIATIAGPSVMQPAAAVARHLAHAMERSELFSEVVDAAHSEFENERWVPPHNWKWHVLDFTRTSGLYNAIARGEKVQSSCYAARFRNELTRRTLVATYVMPIQHASLHVENVDVGAFQIRKARPRMLRDLYSKDALHTFYRSIQRGIPAGSCVVVTRTSEPALLHWERTEESFDREYRGYDRFGFYRGLKLESGTIIDFATENTSVQTVVAVVSLLNWDNFNWSVPMLDESPAAPNSRSNNIKSASCSIRVPNAKEYLRRLGSTSDLSIRLAVRLTDWLFDPPRAFTLQSAGVTNRPSLAWSGYLDLDKTYKKFNVQALQQHCCEAVSGVHDIVSSGVASGIPQLLKATDAYVRAMHYRGFEAVLWFIICLEALFGEKRDDAGVTKLLCNRVSGVMAGASEYAPSMRRLFQELYDVRSGVVHGKSKDFGPVPEGALTAIRHLARTCLLWSLGVGRHLKAHFPDVGHEHWVAVINLLWSPDNALLSTGVSAPEDIEIRVCGALGSEFPSSFLPPATTKASGLNLPC